MAIGPYIRNGSKHIFVSPVTGVYFGIDPSTNEPWHCHIFDRNGTIYNPAPSPPPCDIDNCDECSTDDMTVCSTCTPGYGVTGDGLCGFCEVMFCVQCDADATLCQDCSDEYVPSEGSEECVILRSLFY